MRAKHDGFELVFTKPVNPETAGDTSAYQMNNYTYIYSSAYGSDELQKQDNPITSAVVSKDRMSVRLKVEGMRAMYVHELHIDGVTDQMGEPLIHPDAYYTLNKIPKN